MVLEIWRATGRIFSHFGPFFTILPPPNPKHQKFEKMKKKQKHVEISPFHTSVP